MQNRKLSIIIPAYNEEKFILGTLNSLARQTDNLDKPLSREFYQVVIVNNNSTDDTVKVIEKFAHEHKNLNCFIINEKEKSVVAARITGYNYVLNNPLVTTELLASGDSDVIFHPLWVYTLLEKFQKEHFDVLSNAGCFPLDFWQKVPNLVSRYLDEIGTIFFNRETINWLGVRGKTFLFTEQIFFDFIRLATDQCFAIAKNAYQQVGGYTRDFLDDGKKQEYTNEGGRLLAKLERTTAKIIYSNEAPYTANPRRILNEPEKFLGGKLYFQGESGKDHRSSTENSYKRLNRAALLADYSGIRKYIIKNYILLKCITRPRLLSQNAHYFGNSADTLNMDIQNWWKQRKKIESGREVMEFAELLTNKYYEKIIAIFPKQRVL